MMQIFGYLAAISAISNLAGVFVNPTAKNVHLIAAVITGGLSIVLIYYGGK